MTAMDEIIFKTPDSLFNGDSVVSVLKSCVPSIKDPWFIPQLDIDVLLIAIRIATYGSDLPLTFACKECKHSHDRNFDLSTALSYFSTLNYENEVLCEPLSIKLKPYNYRDYNTKQLQIYQLQRMLTKSLGDLEEEERRKKIDEFSKKLGAIQAESYKLQIDFVEADETVVKNPAEIQDWISNSDKIFFDKIKTHLEKLRDIWKIPDQIVNCNNCNVENTVSVNLDNSNFFVKN